jgi:predicted regulator of Ras-like GTPase activity (Roadblock/LC7/MglB family)
MQTHDRTPRNKALVYAMPGETLGEVATLLEETLKVHRSVNNAVLCTKEGVVVAAVARGGEIDPRVIATVSSALVWGGASALQHLKSSGPTHLIHSTSIERILTIVQPHYHLIIVISRADDAGLNLESFIPAFQSLATRMELVMGSTSDFGKQTILGAIVEEIPEVTQGVLLTLEGLPLGSVGFNDEVEVAAMIGALFANGLTYSEVTDSISLDTAGLRLFITRVDETRLLAVVCPGPNPDEVAQKVRLILDGAT